MSEKQEGKKPVKSSLGIGSLIVYLVLLLAGLANLAYSLLNAENSVDYMYSIINSAILFIVIVCLILTMVSYVKKTKRTMSIVTSLLLIAFIGFNFTVKADILSLPTNPVVPDFTNKSVNKVMEWAIENKVEVEQKREYSDNIPENKVTTQSVEANTLAKDANDIEVIVSDGPNYETIVDVPNMEGWNVDEVVKKIDELHLNNVNIEYNFSDETRDDMYEQSRNGQQKRNEELTLKFSLGKEEDLKPVKLKDLRNETEFKATLWLKRNGIKYDLSREFDKTVDRGKTVSTDPKKDTTINQKEDDPIKLVISKGKEIKVPDLEKMSMKEIIKWANENKVVLAYESEYSEEVKKGKIIRVSNKKGDIIEEGTIVSVVTSKGQLKMVDYGDDPNKVREFAAKYDIELNESDEFSNDVEKGKIIRVSLKPGQVLKNGEAIEMVISNGKSREVPDFNGMTLSKAKDLCKENELTCTVEYQNSEKAKDIVIGQNKRVGSNVPSGASVVLTVSNGQKPTSGSSNTNKGNSSNNGSSNTSGGSTSGGGNNSGGGNTPPACDKSKTTTVTFQSSLNGDSVASTASKYRSAYPGVNFNFVGRPNSYGSNGMVHPDSTRQGSIKANYCDTYTIYVIQN